MTKVEITERKYSVPAVDSAFKIITLLSRKKFRESTLTEIANVLSINPTSCYRILYELQHLSIVKYNPNSKCYSLGPYLVVLGERAKEHLYDLSIINSYLEKMTAKTGITSLFALRVGRNRSTIISKVEGEVFGVNVSVGRHFNLLEGAFGKCIIAHATQSDFERCIATNDLYKDATTEEIENLKKELSEVRENGFGISYNEAIKGIFGVAAPIITIGNQVEMSISFIGMCAQYEKDELQPLIDIVKDFSKEISIKLNSEYSGY